VALRSRIARATRDKETYFVQRCALSKIEADCIIKYIQRAEATFEQNWSNYEAELEKHITGDKANPKLYSDWVQSRDENGNLLWTNIKTLEKTPNHPAERIF
jgi:hypothetical protein